MFPRISFHSGTLPHSSVQIPIVRTKIHCSCIIFLSSLGIFTFSSPPSLMIISTFPLVSSSSSKRSFPTCIASKRFVHQILTLCSSIPCKKVRKRFVSLVIGLIHIASPANTPSHRLLPTSLLTIFVSRFFAVVILSILY